MVDEAEENLDDAVDGVDLDDDDDDDSELHIDEIVDEDVQAGRGRDPRPLSNLEESEHFAAAPASLASSSEAGEDTSSSNAEREQDNESIHSIMDGSEPGAGE